MDELRLFIEKAVERGILPGESLEPTKYALLNFNFNDWLRVNGKWDGKPDSYSEAISDANFQRFLLKQRWTNPTNNFELLRDARQKQFEIESEIYHRERGIAGLANDEFSNLVFRKGWVEKELGVVEQWLCDKYPNGQKKLIKRSAIEKTEIMRYQKMLLEELGELNREPRAGRNKNGGENPTPTTFDELFIEPYWADAFRCVLRELNPACIDEKGNWIRRGGSWGIIKQILVEFESNMVKCNDAILVKILGGTFPRLGFAKDGSPLRKHYKRIDTHKLHFDIKFILSQFSRAGK